MLGNHIGENCRRPQLKLGYTGGTTESVDYFVYESGQVVLQFHENNPTGNLTAGDLVHRYLWDPQQVDQLLADEQVSSLSSPGQVVWPLLNDQNSVTDLAIYEAGITAIANHRVYNAYGNLTSWMGSVGCAFGYTGKYSDPLTRLQFNTNRWYDPATCRWMSQDPLGLAAGPNVYRYAGDNPVNDTDPSGLFVITTGGSGGDQGGGGGSAGDQPGSNPITIQGATDGSSTLVEHELPGGNTYPITAVPPEPKPELPPGWIPPEKMFPPEPAPEPPLFPGIQEPWWENPPEPLPGLQPPTDPVFPSFPELPFPPIFGALPDRIQRWFQLPDALEQWSREQLGRLMQPKPADERQPLWTSWVEHDGGIGPPSVTGPDITWHVGNIDFGFRNPTELVASHS